MVSQRFVEVIETIPFLLLLITLVDLVGGAPFWLLVYVYGLFSVDQYFVLYSGGVFKTQKKRICRYLSCSGNGAIENHV